MVSLSKNYSGRLVDISIFQFEGSRLEGDITLSFGDKVKIITGLEKLKQAFVVILLSNVASVMFEEGRGTRLGTSIGTSNVIPELLYHVAKVSVARTVSIIQADQVDNPLDVPGDEKLQSATLQELQQDEADPSQLRAKIKLVTEEEVTTIYVPLPIALTE